MYCRPWEAEMCVHRGELVSHTKTKEVKCAVYKMWLGWNCFWALATLGIILVLNSLEAGLEISFWIETYCQSPVYLRCSCWILESHNFLYVLCFVVAVLRCKEYRVVCGYEKALNCLVNITNYEHFKNIKSVEVDKSTIHTWPVSICKQWSCYCSNILFY